jgi:alginate O-acetyltransferase complex protein AlgJ
MERVAVLVNGGHVSDGILRGKEDWLFLVGGSNVVATLYDRSSALVSDRQLRKWAELIENRARRLQSLGIQYIHINIPEKLTVYDDKLHEPPGIDWQLSPAVRLGEMVRHLPDVWLDLVVPFRAGRDEKNLFLKTDSHWSLDGCFLCYSLLCERLGVPVSPNLLDRTVHELVGTGDLGLKLEPVVSERRNAFSYVRHAKRIYANPVARYLAAASLPVMHVGSHVRYRNDAGWAVRKKVLIFGDSSSNISADVLTGMLAESLRDVEFIWSSNLDWAYIERSRPDAVVYELVERFMTILPNDQLSLPSRFGRQSVKAQWLFMKEKASALRSRIKSILTNHLGLRSPLAKRGHKD